MGSNGSGAVSRGPSSTEAVCAARSKEGGRRQSTSPLGNRITRGLVEDDRAERVDAGGARGDIEPLANTANG